MHARDRKISYDDPVYIKVVNPQDIKFVKDPSSNDAVKKITSTLGSLILRDSETMAIESPDKAISKSLME